LEPMVQGLCLEFAIPPSVATLLVWVPSVATLLVWAPLRQAAMMADMMRPKNHLVCWWCCFAKQWTAASAVLVRFVCAYHLRRKYGKPSRPKQRQPWRASLLLWEELTTAQANVPLSVQWVQSRPPGTVTLLRGLRMAAHAAERPLPDWFQPHL